MRLQAFIAAALLICCPLFMVACGSGATPSSNSGNGNGGHSHDHGHAHHDVGPNGGHLVKLSPGDYQIEWGHVDKDKLVTAIVLDGEKDEVPVSGVSIETLIDGATLTYDLSPIDPKDDKASRFDKTDDVLLNSIKMTEDGDAKVTVLVEIEGEVRKGEIEHHDHGHKH